MDSQHDMGKEKLKKMQNFSEYIDAIYLKREFLIC